MTPETMARIVVLAAHKTQMLPKKTDTPEMNRVLADSTLMLSWPHFFRIGFQWTTVEQVTVVSDPLPDA